MQSLLATGSKGRIVFNTSARIFFASAVFSGFALAGVVQHAAAQGIPFSLLTITNPTPAADDVFGYSVAAVGTGWVLIGAFEDNTGATNAGAAHLFTFGYPPLTITGAGTDYTIT